MFQAERLLFYYCVSPVHMGAGTAAGVIDNPIQREVHTKHPVFAGSGIKGAVRHRCSGHMEKNDVTAIFGPERNASDRAGAVTFSDAQLVLFPIRSLKGGFVYGTSPIALARLRRMVRNLKASWQAPPPIEAGRCLISNAGLLTNGKLVLETFEFSTAGDISNAISEWLADHCLPTGNEYEFFRSKIKTDLVILSDEEFSHFVENATAVEPHVRISNETGTAEAQGLFYTENLPPEAVLAGHLMMSPERRSAEGRKNGSQGIPRDGEDLLKLLLKQFEGAPLQVGGDATTGRGLVVIQSAEEAEKQKEAEKKGEQP